MAKKHVHRPQGYGPTPSRTAGAAKSRGPARASFPATSRRARFESWSRPLLMRMQRLPGWMVPALLAVVMLLGLALPMPWTGILLVGIAVFLAWLTAVAWPVVSPGSRALRVFVDLALLALGVAKMLGLVLV